MLSTNKASDSIVVVNGRLIDNTPWANKHLQLQERARVVELHPKYSSLQKQVLQRADRGDYTYLWLAAFVGLGIGLGFCLLSYFTK